MSSTSTAVIVAGSAPASVARARAVEFACDSPLEQSRFELVWGFSCQVVFSVYCQFFVRSGKAVLRPVAYDQVRGARGRGQGTETLAQLSGLPLSVACVSRRPLFKPGAGFDA